MTKKVALSKLTRQIALTRATFDWNDIRLIETQRFLENTGITVVKDVQLIEQVLMRMVKKEKKQGSSFSEEELLQTLAKQLIKRARPEILPFLEETETHHLYFDDLNQLLHLFFWIQKKIEDELGQQDTRRQGRRSGRVIKDNYFWKNVYLISCQLFEFFQDHWGCFCTEKGTIPIQSAQITIQTFEITYKLMSNVPPCKIFHLVKTAYQAGIELPHIERLVLTHVPMRIDDFIQLIADEILTSKTCYLFLNNPELIRALSYEGIRHLFRQWKDSGRKTKLLVFAQSIRHELYPNALPDGKKVDDEVLENPRLISSIINIWNNTKQSKGSIHFPDHAYAPGLYKPSNALVLVPDPIIVSSPKEKTLPKEECKELSLGNVDKKHEAFCEDALAAWMRRAELCSCLLDDPYLFTSKEEQTPPPESVAVNPWNDVLYLIKEDICSQTQSSLPADPDLLALHQELNNIEIILRRASLGDVEGVLDQWSVWIDPIRERIKKLDERLKQGIVLTTTPAEVLEETQKTSPPAHEQVPVEDLQAKKVPEIPEGKLGMLVDETQRKLKQLPAGIMRRQFKRQLDTLTSEALKDDKNPSLKADLMKLQAEIQGLLDEISS